MQELKKIRNIELVTIIIVVVLLTGWRLYMEIMHHNNMLAMDQNAQYASLTSYNFWLNTIFPLIALIIFLLIAWYLFHYVVFPKILLKEFIEKDLWYLSVALLVTAAGIFLYHYFKLYVGIVIDQNVIIEMHTESLYRKLSVFSDTVGILIIYGIYELIAQMYYYLYRRLSQEKEWAYTFLKYFLFACAATFLFLFATISPFPANVWQGSTKSLLFYSGLGIQIYVLQHYFYQQVLPTIQAKQFTRFSIYLFVGILLVTASSVIIWICYSQLRWHFAEAVFVSIVVTFFISAIIAYTRHIITKEKTILQTQVSATSAELANLRSQINPHFLFNALNSLYATALKEKSEKTADGIQKLGDMMRFMLEENNQERIPLDKEIEYLHNYIDIQRLRIDESQGVEIKVNIQQPDKEMYIAPMMLNPFVENAFKHGVSLQYPSWIYITLTLDATRLYFKVHNSLHKKAEADPEENSSGVGLVNVRKRLELLYPGKHTLDIQQSDKDFFVSLTLVYTANQAQKQRQNAVAG
jgi:two-component system, LytTR family, sensor kinase